MVFVSSNLKCRTESQCNKKEKKCFENFRAKIRSRASESTKRYFACQQKTNTLCLLLGSVNNDEKSDTCDKRHTMDREKCFLFHAKEIRTSMKFWTIRIEFRDMARGHVAAEPYAASGQ